VDETALAEQLRSFNRFYTEAIGSLDEAHEGTALNLAQSRMVFTVRLLGDPDVGDLADALKLDLAYTSRVLGALEDARLIRRVVSKADRRRRTVTLTKSGERTLAEIEARSNHRVLALVDHLGEHETEDLLYAMATIRRLLEGGMTDDKGT
jgi:DNA-binding MarR family transcriptional regulator